MPDLIPDEERDYQETVEWIMEFGVDRKTVEMSLAWTRASQPVQVEVTELPCAFQMEQCRCALPRGHGGLHECRVHRFSDRPLAALGGGGEHAE